MKKLLKIFKKHKHIVFFDLEGTQHSQEMIAIGAVLCTIDKYGRISKYKKPFKLYVKAKNKIGRFVTNLTGITEAILEKEGVSFLEAMNAFKKYCGIAWKKSLFVSFGNHDLRIFNQTIAYNINSPKELCHQIHANYWDFGSFISNYIKDNNGCMMSLIHYCELFGVDMHQPAHDPEADALNLAKLYDKFIKEKGIVLDEYKKVLANNKKFPEPILAILKLLMEGKEVRPQDFDDAIKEDIE